MSNGTLEMVEVKTVVPSGNNPRVINEKTSEFAELVDSINAQGVVVPVHVRQHPKQKGKLELLAGERRLLACSKAGRDKLPAINHGKLTDEQAFEITFAENFAREDLTPLEQGRAVATLMEKYKGDSKAVAYKMGKSLRWVLQRKALGTKLSKSWQKAVVEDEGFKDYTAGHLQQIAALPVNVQDRFLDDFEHVYETPTIKELEQTIAAELCLLSTALWAKEKQFEKCSKCIKRTSRQPGLFDDTVDAERIKKNDRCLDPDCYQSQMLVWLKAEFEKKQKDYPGLIATTTDSPGSRRENQFREVWRGLVPHHSCKKQSTKKVKDGVPALVVYGKGTGSIVWNVPYSQPSGRTKIAGKPTPLAERRTMLQNKRAARFLIKLAEIVESKQVKDLVAKDKTAMVMALAHEFGVADPYAGITNYYAEDVMRPWKATDTLVAGKVNDVREKLWVKVRTVLVRNLNYSGPITQTPKVRIDAAKKLASLFAVDVRAMEKEIADKTPEPKTWAGLNEDGTPKAMKKKAKSSGKGKKPAAKKKSASKTAKKAKRNKSAA